MSNETGFNSPQRTVIDDEIMATIPYQEYMELRAERLAVDVLRAHGVLNGDDSLGLFTRDPEVAIFIAVRQGVMTAREIVTDIEQRFGAERKPSVCEVKRFWFRFQCSLIPAQYEKSVKPSKEGG